jgi:hypothetical protein
MFITNVLYLQPKYSSIHSNFQPESTNTKQQQQSSTYYHLDQSFNIFQNNRSHKPVMTVIMLNFSREQQSP